MRLVANSNNTSDSIRPLEELVGYRSTDISLILFREQCGRLAMFAGMRLGRHAVENDRTDEGRILS